MHNCRTQHVILHHFTSLYSFDAWRAELFLKPPQREPRYRRRAEINSAVIGWFAVSMIRWRFCRRERVAKAALLHGARGRSTPARSGQSARSGTGAKSAKRETACGGHRRLAERGSNLGRLLVRRFPTMNKRQAGCASFVLTGDRFSFEEVLTNIREHVW